MKLRFLKDRDEEEKASNFLDFKTEERANSFKEKGIYDKLIQDEKDIILREREENDAQSSITDEELSKFSGGNIMEYPIIPTNLKIFKQFDYDNR